MNLGLFHFLFLHAYQHLKSYFTCVLVYPFLPDQNISSLRTGTMSVLLKVRLPGPGPVLGIWEKTVNTHYPGEPVGSLGETDMSPGRDE